MSHYTISKGFTSEQMKEVEKLVGKLAEGLCELKEYFQEIGIENKEIREIPFLNVLNTAMNAGVEGLKEYISDEYKCDNFDSWKKAQEIFEDVEVEILIEFENGSSETVSGTFNAGTGKVECDSDEMMRDDITRISFTSEDCLNCVCLDCGEYIVKENGQCVGCG